MGKYSTFLDFRVGGSTDSRWGVFATAFSLGWAFLAFAVSFYTASEGGGIMGFVIAAWIFGVIGAISLVCAILVVIRWWRNPLYHATAERLTKLEKSVRNLTKAIHGLAEEIKQARDERNKSK